MGFFGGEEDVMTQDHFLSSPKKKQLTFKFLAFKMC